jgi:hypothetical protein
MGPFQRQSERWPLEAWHFRKVGSVRRRLGDRGIGVPHHRQGGIGLCPDRTMP